MSFVLTTMQFGYGIIPRKTIMLRNQHPDKEMVGTHPKQFIPACKLSIFGIPEMPPLKAFSSLHVPGIATGYFGAF